MEVNDQHILIIGGHNTGKTHFGGQLLGRLMDRKGKYKADKYPDDTTIFQEALRKMNKGLAASHTHQSQNGNIEIRIDAGKRGLISLAFPDYGGEQINQMVKDRDVPEVWKKQIVSSGTWMLFIRLDEIETPEDVATRGLPDVEELEKRNQTEITGNFVTPQAFFIELLQILLFARREETDGQTKDLPTICVALMCCDRILNELKEKTPFEVFKTRLPMLCDFIQTKWLPENSHFIGISSTGCTLDEHIPNEEFEKLGPTEHGYFLNGNGEEIKDLTKILALLIGDND